MEGWTGFAVGAERRGFARRSEALACRLYPHRATLVTLGLGVFLAGALPLAEVAHGGAALASWKVAAFAASVPGVLWALCLAIHATFFDPRRGLVANLGRGGPPRPEWTTRFVRSTATLTVAGFAVAPLVVLLAAAVA